MAKKEPLTKFLGIICAGDPDDENARRRAWSLYLDNREFINHNQKMTLVTEKHPNLATSKGRATITRANILFGFTFFDHNTPFSQIERSAPFRTAMLRDLEPRPAK